MIDMIVHVHIFFMLHVQRRESGLCSIKCSLGISLRVATCTCIRIYACVCINIQVHVYLYNIYTCTFMSNYKNVIYICTSCLMRQKKFQFFSIDLFKALRIILPFYLTYMQAYYLIELKAIKQKYIITKYYISFLILLGMCFSQD